ncbi:MAG: hypothetical protein ACERKO_03470 [Acetanaerobacterium sp.]
MCFIRNKRLALFTLFLSVFVLLTACGTAGTPAQEDGISSGMP